MVEKKRILIVEGNTRKENNEFTEVGIKTHTESLIDSINYYGKKLEIDIANPSSDKYLICLLYTSPSPRDLSTSRMPSSA